MKCLLLIHFFGAILISVTSNCPTNCDCSLSIGSVHCQAAELNEFPPNIDPSTTSLHLQYNHIPTLTKTKTNGLNRLKYLYMDGNSLGRIDKDALCEMPNLVRLSLDNTNVSSLASRTFDCLGRLEELNLARNSLTSLPANAFFGLRKLKYLNLEGNKLSRLDKEMFSGLIRLQFLQISRNKITVLRSNILSNLTQLQYLYLNANGMTFIHQMAFHGFKIWISERID